MKSLQKQYFNFGNKRIAYYDVGQGNPILFLHGFATSSDLWTNIISKMDLNSYRCIAPDLPGFGDTVTPLDVKYGLDFYVENLLLFYLKISEQNSKPTIVAHGLGTSLALAWTIHHPGLCENLVLANPIFYMDKPPSYLSKYILAAKNSYFWKFYIKSKLFRFNVHQTFKNGYSPSGVFPESEANEFLRPFDLSVTASLRLQKVLTDLNFEVISNLSGFIRKIKLPTLIFYGQDDSYIKKEYLTQLKTDLPFAKTVELPNTGFYIPLEKPNVFAFELTNFLNK